MVTQIEITLDVAGTPALQTKYIKCDVFCTCWTIILIYPLIHLLIGILIQVLETDIYILGTTILGGGKMQLFLGMVKPSKPVTRATIGRWLKEVLKQVVEAFKSHKPGQLPPRGHSQMGHLSMVFPKGKLYQCQPWQQF